MFRIQDGDLAIEVDSLQELLAYRAARKIASRPRTLVGSPPNLFAPGLRKIFEGHYKKDLRSAMDWRKRDLEGRNRREKRRAYQVKWRARNKTRIKAYNKARNAKLKK